MTAKEKLRIASLIVMALGIAAPLSAAENPTPVDVVLDDVSVNKVPFLIAADTGIYAKYGLAVRQLINPDAVDVARSRGVTVPAENINTGLRNPTIVISGGSWWLARVGRQEYVDRVIVSTTEDVLRDHVIAQSSVARIEDLKGKRLGYSSYGSVIHYGDLSIVRKMGWTAGKDITLVPDAANLNALKTGKVDAILANALVTGSVKPQMGFKDLGDLTQYHIPLAGSGIMVERQWLMAHRDATARFIKAAVEATALMKSDRAVFDAAVAKWFNITDATTLDRMYAATAEITDKPYPSVDGIKLAMAVFDSPAMRTHRPEDFYDSRFIAALDKEGFLAHPLK